MFPALSVVGVAVVPSVIAGSRFNCKLPKTETLLALLAFNFWLHALGETESDERRGKAWQVSYRESFAAKAQTRLQSLNRTFVFRPLMPNKRF
jgi:hypothetical protein